MGTKKPQEWIDQKHAGKLRGDGKAVWHTNQSGDYWCGLWHDRSPRQLYEECKTIIADLEKNHPELALKQ